MEDKDKGKKGSAEIKMINIEIQYLKIGNPLDGSWPSNTTFASLRDDACRHYKMAKKDWKDYTLIDGEKDCLESSRATLTGASTVKRGIEIVDETFLRLVKYEK